MLSGLDGKNIVLCKISGNHFSYMNINWLTEYSREWKICLKN